MNISFVLPLTIAIFGEIGRELCFKSGSHLESRKGFLADIFGKPIIWLGFMLSGVEIVAWLMVLQRAPLSLAFAMMSLCYCGMVLASKIFLKEKIPLTRWLGVGMITAGVAIISSMAENAG